MTHDRSGRLHVAAGLDPLERLRQDLQPLWRGPIIGPGVQVCESLTMDADRRIRLEGLPDPFAIELAWMAHWQAGDGTRCSVQAINQLATILRRALRDDHPVPDSLRALDWDTASALQGWYYTARWGRLPSGGLRKTLRVLTRFTRLALIARCHDGPRWELDEWHPRCDQRIPMSQREPLANYGCSPGRIVHRWLREAVKWQLGTSLEAGTLRWLTISQDKMPCLARFDRWLSVAFNDPRYVLGAPTDAAAHAAAFRRWDSDPLNRRAQRLSERYQATTVDPRLINDDVRAIAELFAFVEANRVEATRVLGPSPWQQLSEAHAASWFRQVSRIPHRPELNAQHYVDDHALAQITAALPLLGLPREEQLLITRSTEPRCSPTASTIRRRCAWSCCRSSPAAG